MSPSPILGIVAAAAALFAAGACGYTPLSSSNARDPGAISRIAVPAAINETAVAGIAAPFTEEVRKQLAALGVRVVEPGEGVPVLGMVIASVGDETGMTVRSGSALLPADTVWRIEVMVSVESAAGERIVPPTRFSGDGRSAAIGGTAGEEYTSARTQREIMNDLAARIAAMIALLQ